MRFNLQAYKTTLAGGSCAQAGRALRRHFPYRPPSSTVRAESGESRNGSVNLRREKWMWGMVLVAGVDSTLGVWCAVISDAGQFSTRKIARLSDIYDDAPGFDIIAIDIPV